MGKHRINVQAKVLHYTARHECVTGCGSYFRASYTLTEVLEPAITLDEHLEADLRTRVPDIPVGWRMDGRDKLTCPACQQRNAEAAS